MPESSIPNTSHDYSSNIADQSRTRDRAPAKPPVLLACIECRTRHLKCDAILPVCGRCQFSGVQCQYVQSRRGYRGPRKRPRNELNSQEPKLSGLPNCVGSNEMPIPTDHSIQSSSTALTSISPPLITPPPTSLTENSSIQLPINHLFHQDSINQGYSDTAHEQDLSNIYAEWPQHTGNPISSSYVAESPISKNLLESYYTHFHDAHPILLPRKCLSKGVVGDHPQCLEVIMQFIGSHYIPNESTGPYRNAANNAILIDTSRNVYKVQALLLFAIALHVRDEQTEAQQMLSTATELALSLGMNLKEFASINGKDLPFLEESWRRTWWELYIIDGMIATLHGHTSFSLYSVYIDALLPCEEVEYSTGKSIPQSSTMADFHNRAFATDNVVYSSFAYRIEAMRLLGTVLALGQPSSEDDSEQVEAVDASLTGWKLRLPSWKRDVLDADGKVDEVLFQAHMISNASLIFLHRPRSSLNFSEIQDQTPCTRRQKHESPVAAYHIHSSKAMQSANILSNFISLPTSLAKHTPFFTCAITLSAIVHLSAYSLAMYKDTCNSRKERIHLAMGALTSISENWPIAGNTIKQVKEVARHVLTILQSKDIPQPLVDTSSITVDSFGYDNLWLKEMAEYATNDLTSLNYNAEGY